MKNLIILFSFLIISCSKSNTKKSDNPIDTTSINTASVFDKKFQNRVKMDSLRDRILYHGDTTAYKDAKIIYILSGYRKEFLTYAIVMSGKYKYSKAGADVKFLFDYKTDSLNAQAKLFFESFKKDSIKWSGKLY